jgi:hypothetical protein
VKNHIHERNAECCCSECIEDRLTRGCKNPHACAIAAVDRMRQIRPKWTASNTITLADAGEGVDLFIRPTGITSLGQGLRTLTKRTTEAREQPAPRIRRRMAAATPPTDTVVYVSNTIHALPRHRKSAAAGLFYGVNETKDSTYRRRRSSLHMLPNYMLHWKLLEILMRTQCSPSPVARISYEMR